MTQIADDRSWWAEVEHLRPGAGPSEPARDGAAAPPEPPPVRHGRITGRPLPAAPEPEKLPAVLRRADAAAFADAMDLDGAFAAPAGAARSREIVLTGTSAAGEEPDDDGGEAYEEEHFFGDDAVYADEVALEADAVIEGEAHDVVVTGADAQAHAPAVRGQGSPDRKTVRITGHPGIHGELAERRALREIQPRGPRRARSAVERVGHQPDRIAMWAVLLGLFLVIIAATSSSAGVA